MNTSLAEGKYNLNLFSIDVVEPVLKIFSRFGVKAVFFASVFECCRFNKNTIRDVIQHIDSQGHDIQLHTHPFWCYGREHMWQYSLSEQIDIISHGCELLKEWTGRYPVAHRAGAYGINQNTLKALRENDIFIDSSMFHRYDNCKVTWSINEIVKKEGIVEVPVTGFFRQQYISLGCCKIKYKKKFIKTDINWCSIDELFYFVEQAQKNNIKIMNLFMHSYSLLKYNSKSDRFDINESNKQKLMEFLQTCTQNKNIYFITIQKFWEMYQQDPHQFSGSNYVPTTSTRTKIFKF
jgi:hypothetical protein